MTTRYRDMKVDCSRCRNCDHDLYVIARGLNAGQVRCTNARCKFNTAEYKMGSELNRGLAPA